MPPRALLLLLFPLLVSCGPSQEKRENAIAKQYAQAVLNRYRTKNLGRHLEPTAAFGIPCRQVLNLKPPEEVFDCQLNIWGAQAIAAVNVKGKRLLRVGEFTTPRMTHDRDIKAFGRAVADDYRQWVKTPAFQTWMKSFKGKNTATDWGFSIECDKFSPLELPTGVNSCVQGPGPADGPTIILHLVDGRWFEFDAL